MLRVVRLVIGWYTRPHVVTLSRFLVADLHEQLVRYIQLEVSNLTSSSVLLRIVTRRKLRNCLEIIKIPYKYTRMSSSSTKSSLRRSSHKIFACAQDLIRTKHNFLISRHRQPGPSAHSTPSSPSPSLPSLPPGEPVSRYDRANATDSTSGSRVSWNV